MGRRGFIISVVVALVIVVGSVLAYVSFNSPAAGIVFNSNTTAPGKGITKAVNLVFVHGQQATFSYPAILRPAELPGVQAPILEAYLYTYDDTDIWQLNISVVKLSNDSISSDSGYDLRASQPGVYDKSNQMSGGNNYVIMTDTKSSGFNEVAYTVNNNRVAEISLTGDSPSGISGLQKVMSDVLGSWRWSS